MNEWGKGTVDMAHSQQRNYDHWDPWDCWQDEPEPELYDCTTKEVDMVHGQMGDWRNLDAICRSKPRVGYGYTKDWDKVTCGQCRKSIDAGYDFTTATE